MRMSDPDSEGLAPRDAGFTLLEALMALLIVGLLASVAALSAPAPEARAKAEAQRLAARLVLAGDDSVFRNRVVGLVFTDQGYGFARLETTGWTAVEEAGPLRFHALPADVSVRLVTQVDRVLGPVVAQFDPMGSATPLRIGVEGGGGAFVVIISSNGGAHVERAS
jgi:type II secretion system protein H